jgi:hypothetical protein
MEEPSPVAGKGKTDALWSIETNAYLCGQHALSGLDVTLMLEANESATASVRVLPRGSSSRRVPIKQG